MAPEVKGRVQPLRDRWAALLMVQYVEMARLRIASDAVSGIDRHVLLAEHDRLKHNCVDGVALAVGYKKWLRDFSRIKRFSSKHNFYVVTAYMKNVVTNVRAGRYRVPSFRKMDEAQQWGDQQAKAFEREFILEGVPGSVADYKARPAPAPATAAAVIAAKKKLLVASQQLLVYHWDGLPTKYRDVVDSLESNPLDFGTEWADTLDLEEDHEEFAPAWMKHLVRSYSFTHAYIYLTHTMYFMPMPTCTGGKSKSSGLFEGCFPRSGWVQTTVRRGCIQCCWAS